MGSLFSGSGGFELAASLNGIRPVWSSEIEPFPIRVTTKRFPQVKHLGDINKIDGDKITPVDIITFSSPCQGLSVAGKRKGLIDHRSFLYYEAIRIIKEMRQKTNGEYPKFIVWENVTGVFGTAKGEDFRLVLEEIAHIFDDTTIIPRPPQRKWQDAGAVMGDGWSLAWRVFDSQFWSIPQRRRRIYLVADLGGHRAPQVLFERDSLQGNFTQSTETQQTTSFGSAKSVDRASQRVKILEMTHADEVIREAKDNICPTLQARMGTGGNQVPLVFALDRASYNQGINAQYPIQVTSSGIHYTLVAKGPGAVCAPPEYIVRKLTPLECCRLQGFPDFWCSDLETPEPTAEDILFWRNVFETHSQATKGKVIRKTDKQIVKWLKNPYSDSAQYKMWGNGIALPNALYVLEGIAAILSSKE